MVELMMNDVPDASRRLTIPDLDLKIGLIRDLCALDRLSDKVLLRESDLDRRPDWLTKVMRGEQSIGRAELEAICDAHEAALRRAARVRAGDRLLSPADFGRPFEAFWAGLDEALAAQAEAAQLQRLRRKAADFVFTTLSVKGVKRSEQGKAAEAVQLVARISEVKPPADLDQERFFDASESPDGIPDGEVYAGGSFTLTFPVREPGRHHLWLFGLRAFIEDVAEGGLSRDAELVRWSPRRLDAQSQTDDDGRDQIRLREVRAAPAPGEFLLRAVAIPADLDLEALRLGPEKTTPHGVGDTWRFMRAVESARRPGKGGDRISLAACRYRIIAPKDTRPVGQR